MTEKEKREIAEKIKKQYVNESGEQDKIQKLIKLNKKATQLPMIISLVVGILGALVAGFGMSLVMTDLGNTLNIEKSLVVGIIIGVLGLAVCIANYPLYKSILDSKKEKYASQIISLSDEILK